MFMGGGAWIHLLFREKTERMVFQASGYQEASSQGWDRAFIGNCAKINHKKKKAGKIRRDV